jgi:hypothetical protein
MKLRAMRVCVGAVVCLGIAAAMLLGERPPAVPEYRVPLVQDWTHRSLIYSAPRTILQNLQLQQQTRYAQQYLRRNVFFRGPMGPPIFDPIRILRKRTNGLQRDWGIAVGSGFTVGQGNFPAKYTFNNAAALTAASCANDYVVFTTNQAGGLNIYAVNNLYVNAAGTGHCAGLTNPTVLWAYHVESQGATGTSNTSPVLSLDGTQIAWVEGSVAGGHTAALHILKPNISGVGQGTIAAPITPAANATSAAYVTCKATAGPCLRNIPFGNTDDDSGDAAAISPSSPFYDYGSDEIFVGDDGGNLHEFTGVFTGTPAEVTAGGWPVATMSGDAAPQLGSPTYDETSENVFVGDASGRIMYVRTAAGSAGTCLAGSNGGNPPCVGSTTFVDPDGAGATIKISAAPIVDSTTQQVFVFFSPNGGGSGQYVGQDDTKLTVANQVTVHVGFGTSWRLNQGTLDNSYYTTDTALNTGTGFLYACGNNGTMAVPTNNQALLQRIAVTNGKLGSTVDATNWLASSATSRCSPLTEYYNTPNGSSVGAVDYLFFAVEASGSPAACGGDGCVFALTITGGTLTVPPALGTGTANAPGTSGIIVDNDNTSASASSIYFSWLVNPPAGPPAPYLCNGASLTGSVCAVKLTQNGLN